MTTVLKSEKQKIIKKKTDFKRVWSCYLMGGVPFLGLLVFTMIPMAVSGYLSFTELHTRNFLDAEWIGIQNYVKLFNDPLFGKAILNTLYSLLSVPINLCVGLVIAMTMNAKRVYAKQAVRIIFFIPYLCSASVVASTFQMIFDAEFGVINTILRDLSLPTSEFFRDEKLFMPLMFLLMAWSKMGYYALLFYAALTGVPKTVLEAAEIDGATSVTSFFKITLPLISPTTFYLFTTGLITGLQVFAEFQIIAGGMSSIFSTPWGPNNAGVTVVYYLYISSFQLNFTYGLGYGSAMAWVLAIIVVILTILNFRFQKKWVHYD